MIAFVRAYSHEEATDALFRGSSRELARYYGDLIEHPNRVAWMGFEPVSSPLHQIHVPIAICARKLVLRFNDFGDPPIATLAHARQIVAFVREIAAYQEQWALAIHCTAGIGRSGTVSRWVQDHYHVLPEWRYAALHTRCQPRGWLMDLLERAEIR